MDPDLLVGPMMHRPPATGVGGLQGSEPVFQLILAPVAPNDVGSRPSVLVGEEDGLAEESFLEARFRLLVQAEGKSDSARAWLDLEGEEFFQMTGLEQGFHLARHGSDGRRVAFGMSLSPPPSQTLLQTAQRPLTPLQS